MATPTTTRLRYIRSASADELSEFVGRLPYRVQVYSLAWDGSAWFLWYVPPDDQSEVQPNLNLEDL